MSRLNFRFRLPGRRLVIVLLAVVALSIALPAAAQGGTRQQPTAAEMFAALNAWRLEQGLAPFKYNATLEALATLQLQYILAQPGIPSNIHDGILGEGIRERALWPAFNWPYYDDPERIDVVEISVAARTVERGIIWWKNSPIHNESATNPNYREAGVAALPYRYGTVFVAVLGGRPDVLPALVHPDGQTLYLTNESFWGQSPTSIGRVRRVRLLDSDRTTVLADWRPWRATLPMPEVSGDTLYVELSDNRTTVTTEVALATDVIALPGAAQPAAAVTLPAAAANPALPTVNAQITLEAATPDTLVLRASAPEPVYLADFRIFALLTGETPVVRRFTQLFPGLVGYAAPETCFVLQVAGARLAPPAGCTGPLVVYPVAAEDVFWHDPQTRSRTAIFVLSEQGRLIGNCQAPAAVCSFGVTASTTPPGTPGSPAARPTRQIELVYSPLSFALINRGSAPLSLLGLSFQNGSVSFSTGVWSLATSSAPLAYFPANDCLQVWGFGDSRQPKPAGCAIRHAWTTIHDNQKVWLEGAFNVMYRGNVLTTCEAAAGSCTFELPG